MSREIEFRIFANNKWYYKCLVGNTNDTKDNNWTCPLIWLDDKKEWVHCDNGIICQYTGLKDKNGVKIFEGDIVKTVGYHHSTPHKIEETNFVVVWSFTHWVLQRKLKTGGVEEILLGDEDDEVIGNIYENPELLEVQYESETN